MIARRRDVGTRPWDLEPGDYTVGPTGQVWARLPNGSGPVNLTTWSPVEHDDGTLTLSPSILAHARPDCPEWHGWLERGVWREA